MLSVTSQSLSYCVEVIYSVLIPRILLNVSPPYLSSLDVSEDLLVHSFMACEQHGFQITRMFIKNSNKY